MNVSTAWTCSGNVSRSHRNFDTFPIYVEIIDTLFCQQFIEFDVEIQVLFANFSALEHTNLL